MLYVMCAQWWYRGCAVGKSFAQSGAAGALRITAPARLWSYLSTSRSSY